MGLCFPLQYWGELNVTCDFTGCQNSKGFLSLREQLIGNYYREKYKGVSLFKGSLKKKTEMKRKLFLCEFMYSVVYKLLLIIHVKIMFYFNGLCLYSFLVCLFYSWAYIRTSSVLIRAYFYLIWNKIS